MRKRVAMAAYAALMLAMAALVTACDQTNKLVGTWHLVSVNNQMIDSRFRDKLNISFLPSGEYVQHTLMDSGYDICEKRGRYEYTRTIIHFMVTDSSCGGRDAGTADLLNYYVSGNSLVLTQPENKITAIFNRK